MSNTKTSIFSTNSKNRSRNLKLEEDMKQLEQKKFSTISVDKDTNRLFDLKNSQELIGRNKSIIKESLDLGIKSLKTINKHNTFITIARERFKSYTKMSHEKSKSVNMMNGNLKNYGIKANKMNESHLESHRNKNSSMVKLKELKIPSMASIQISNYSTKHTNNTLLNDNNNSNSNYLLNAIKESNFFLTNHSHLLSTQNKMSNTSNKEHNQLNLFKAIFSNHQEAKLYNNINLIGSSLQSSDRTQFNQTYKLEKKPATIDPDFFIKHEEKLPNKRELINFITNPGLIKRGLLKNVDKKNKDKNRLRTYSIEAFDKRREEINRHTNEKNENYKAYSESFNKFRVNRVKLHSDYKNLIFNSKTDNFYKSLDTIKDLAKAEMKLRSDYKAINDKDNTLLKSYESVPQDNITKNQQILKKEKFTKIDHNIHSYSDANAILNQDEKLVLGYITSDNFRTNNLESSGKEEIKTFRTINSNHLNDYNNLKPNQEKIEKFITYPIKMNEKFYHPKSPAKGSFIFRRMKFQDQEILSKLKQIYSKEEAEKTIKFGMSLQS